jgi:hypothetical protein
MQSATNPVEAVLEYKTQTFVSVVHIRTWSSMEKLLIHVVHGDLVSLNVASKVVYIYMYIFHGTF